MNIRDEWIIIEVRRGSAIIGADDGATYSMDESRARRLVALWNAHLGVPTNKIKERPIERPAEGGGN